MLNNSLWPQDEALFTRMESEYTSHNEKKFFETLHMKQLYEPAFSVEQLLLENDESNYDRLYFLRVDWDEYIIGHDAGVTPEARVHVMNLSEAVSLNLKKAGILNRDITFGEWLHERDYNGIHYNRNLDLV